MFSDFQFLEYEYERGGSLSYCQVCRGQSGVHPRKSFTNAFFLFLMSEKFDGRSALSFFLSFLISALSFFFIFGLIVESIVLQELVELVVLDLIVEFIHWKFATDLSGVE